MTGSMGARFAAFSLLLAGLAAPALADDSAASPTPETRAFLAVQEVMNQSTSRAFANLGAELASGDAALGALLDRRQALVRKLEEARSQQLSAVAAGRDTSTEAADARAADIAGTVEAIAAIDRELATSAPRIYELLSPQPLGQDELRAVLREGEMALLIIPFGNATFSFAVTRDGSAWNRSELGADEVGRLVASLRRGLNVGKRDAFAGEVEAGRGFDHAAAHRLYAELVQPLEATLKGNNHVILVTSGALSALPFALLETAPFTGDDPGDFAAAQWFGLQYGISVLPSFNALKLLREDARPSAASRDFLGLGNPVLLGKPKANLEGAAASVQESLAGDIRSVFRGADVDVEAVRELEPLNATEYELQSFAKALQVPDPVILTADAASETQLRSLDARQFKIVAFATHGLVSGDLNGLAEPALVLTPPDTPTGDDDGLLTASEIAALDLDANWVILSACNTAAGDRPGAEGLSGLVRAFFFAGARSLLVSHWPVYDVYADDVTVGMLTRLRDNPGMGRAEAMRLTMVDLVEDQLDFGRADPKVWAAFILVGDGGPATVAAAR